MKNKFEKEIMEGMAKELTESSYITKEIEKTVDYISAAIEILDDYNIKESASKLVDILIKVANPIRVNQKTIVQQDIPALSVICRRARITQEHLIRVMKEVKSRSFVAIAELNDILRRAALTPDQIKKFIGEKNFLPKEVVKEYLDPESGPRSIMRSIEETRQQAMKPGDEFLISRIAKKKKKKKKKHKDTSSDFVRNLRDHGTMFGYPHFRGFRYYDHDLYDKDSDKDTGGDLGMDDGDFGGDMGEVDDMNSTEDLLNLDIDEQNIYVDDAKQLEDFEDEV